MLNCPLVQMAFLVGRSSLYSLSVPLGFNDRLTTFRPRLSISCLSNRVTHRILLSIHEYAYQAYSTSQLLNMCLPPRVAMEKAEHKQFSVQGFWDEHFGEGSDDETDDESSDDERSDSGESSHEPGTDADDDTTNKNLPYLEDPPLELNYDALKHIAEHFLPGSHGACTDVTTLECGWFNEERILHFEDGWSCFDLFARDPKDKILEQVESSLATIEYVRAHTSIPVPQIYFVNHDENHVVGSAFILMERMPGTGETLYDVWDELSREQKIDLVGDVAGILGQLAELRCDSIGCLRHDGTVDPLLSVRGEARKLGDQPVTTMKECIDAYLHQRERPKSIRRCARLLSCDQRGALCFPRQDGQ